MKRFLLSVLLVTILYSTCFSQIIDEKKLEKKYRIMFYNVENHFDSEFDSTLSYNEFTPVGDLHWTKKKYERKRNNIYKVIKGLGGWDQVTLIGLAEIENEFVIADLISSTPLKKNGYDFVHYDSDDARGIDVALLYHAKSFNLVSSSKIKIVDPENSEFTTRDMLYVKGLLSTDTIHIIVSHWTSRYRGYLESESLRVIASQTLIKLVDSICFINSNANILVMGDFNDNPTNKSMQLITNTSMCKFNNLNLLSTNKDVLGTLKYQSSWSKFDQVLVSNSLKEGTTGLICEPTGHIFDPDFLLLPDEKYMGLKPYRTNIGFKYQGGFSDHLPIYFDINLVR